MDKSTSRGRMIFITESVNGGQDVAFRRRVRVLLHLEQFKAALDAVVERGDWDTDPEALRQLGVILHHFAPRARDPRYAYSCARQVYRRAAGLTQDVTMRAEALANVGTAYLDEQRWLEADVAYIRSLAVEPANRFGLLGRLSVACATHDLETIRQHCAELTRRIPAWFADRDIVTMLATDPDYAVLRAHGALVLECFGGRVEDLQALHVIQRVKRLEAIEPDGAGDGLVVEAPLYPESYDRPSAPPLIPRDTFDSLEDLMDGGTWIGVPSEITARTRLGFV